MENKREYQSFDEINLDLQIYKTEKEIAGAKVFDSYDNIKESGRVILRPLNIVKTLAQNASNLYSKNGLTTLVTTYGINYLFKKLINRKNN